MITTSLVQNMNPCEDRLDNFVQQYPDYSGSLADFLSLTNITYTDKLWVASRYLSFDQMVKWSIKCADSVKLNWIGDTRVNTLINHLKTITDFSSLTQEQKDYISSLLWDHCCVNEIGLYESGVDKENSASLAASKFAGMSALYSAKFAIGDGSDINACFFASCSASMKARQLDLNINESVEGDYSSSIHANAQKQLNLDFLLQV